MEVGVWDRKGSTRRYSRKDGHGLGMLCLQDQWTGSVIR